MENLHLHIENYILTHLQWFLCKFYILSKENTPQIDDQYLNLYLKMNNKNDLLTPFQENLKWKLPEILASKTINKHWIFSKNELILNQQFDIEKRMEKCKEDWKGVLGEDHFYILNEYSSIRRLMEMNDPVRSILSELLRHHYNKL